MKRTVELEDGEIATLISKMIDLDGTNLQEGCEVWVEDVYVGSLLKNVDDVEEDDIYFLMLIDF